MATRIFVQFIVQGVSIFSRSFFSAYNQALHNARTKGTTIVKHKMQMDEALKILNLDGSSLSLDSLTSSYKKMFDNNDPGKGGSFYLQSKIYRAKEVLEYELKKGDETNTSGDAADTSNASEAKQNAA